MKVQLEIKEVANGYILTVDGKDDSQIWVCEGIANIDRASLGSVILAIMKAST